MITFGISVLKENSKLAWAEIRWPDHFLWRNLNSSEEWQKADKPFSPSTMPGSLFNNRILFIFEE